ncbi:MAG: hypothetical protein K6E13_06840 [Lachnospiraceae bacterium]|nr:hypothetical protein [Lachnospiraceae bacterium]
MLFDKFIEKMDDLNDRQAFVNSIFDTMAKNGAVTVDEFMKEGPFAFENLLITVIGDNEEGLNPLKSVKDNIVTDVKNTRAAKLIEDNKDKMGVLRIAISFLIAICCYAVPDNFIETVFAIGVFVVVVFQVISTMIHLKKSNWDLNKEKIRVTISITFLVAYTILIVKDDALFILSSIMFGIFFLANCYQYVIKMKETKDKLCRYRYMIEAALTFLYGGFITIAPDVGLTWFTISLGSFYLMDAIFEIIHIYRLKKGTLKIL